MELKHYRKLLKEIHEGFSSFYIKDKIRYIKHQSNADLVDYDDVYDLYYNKAKSRNLPTEKEIYEKLDEDGIWTEKDENEIETQTFYLEGLIKNKKNLYLKSALDQVNIQIREAEAKVQELKEKKSSLISNCCETYATNRANDFFIVNSFYKDKNLKTKLYTEEEYEYAEAKEVSDLVSIYNEFHFKFSEKSIQDLVLQDFYRIYYAFTESVSDFFGKPVLELTNFQMTLIVYTRVFKNIFDQNENIPERIKKDPDALLDYANSAEAREKIKQQMSDDKAGSTIMGATEEDLEELGMATSKGISLSEEAKKRGGELSMKDLMDLSGA